MSILLWCLMTFVIPTFCQAICPPKGKITTIKNNVHYWVPPKLTTFQEANNLCQDNGMVLANITTLAMVNQVLQVGAGSVSLWTGVYNPFKYWMSCSNKKCHYRLTTVYGRLLNYHDLNISMVVKPKHMCLELGQNSSLLSQDCQALLQPICEADCSPADPCIRPNSSMFQLHGRWIVYFNAEIGNGKTFEEIKVTCQRMNSQVVFVKESRDKWSPSWIALHRGGPTKEIYIGLDPNSLTRACTADNWADSCEGLRWLDGTPYDRRAVTWGVETHGQTSVGCFVLRYDPRESHMYIRGVNDCDVKRSSTCISGCLYPRCPIPRTLEYGRSGHDGLRHSEGDQTRLVLLLTPIWYCLKTLMP